MPWTFAHPAAVLPLRRLGALRLPLVGLVVGSIAPDLGYYVGRFDMGTFAHSGLGILLFCIPVSVALSLLVIRWRLALTAPLPTRHRNAIDRLATPDTASLAGIASLVAATFVGALTHVLWDSFTHATGEAVRSISVLRALIGVYGGRNLYVYNVLQHASTALGLLVLVIGYWRWLRRSDAVPRDAGPVRGLSLVAALALAAVLLGLYCALWIAPPAGSISRLVVRVVMYATTVFATLYVALAMLMVRDK